MGDPWADLALGLAKNYLGPALIYYWNPFPKGGGSLAGEVAIVELGERAAMARPDRAYDCFECGQLQSVELAGCDV